MATSSLFLLLLAIAVVVALKEALCKECTNTPSASSHTIRYALLTSQNLTSENRNLLENIRALELSENLVAIQLKESYREEPELDQVLHSNKLVVDLNSNGNNRGVMGIVQQVNTADPYSRIREALELDENPIADTEPFLQEVSLHDVVLHPDSLQGRAQQTNLEYLLMLDVDKLVWSFRNVSNLSSSGLPYGGWEAPTSELRGHFVGHYMSATAQMWASTHNQTLYDKMTAVVNALFECQQEVGTGYLSAFPSELFDRFEEIKPVWAPYYTIHKIMAGLLDQYTFAGNKKAFMMAIGMADYFNERVLQVIDLHTIERHWQSLNEEVGGMNDVLYRLYTLTDSDKYLKLAHLFDKPCFLGLLAVQADSLSDFHANTHIPLVVGAQMRFEVTGEKLYKDISSYFMDIVNTSHAYPTGGTSVDEFWTDPSHLGDTLSSTETEESCTTYNMLKVSRHLFRWTREMKYADYYERALTNGVLSIQRSQEPGVMIYMLPMGKGQSKAISYHGWGKKFESFWCCYGTGIESFSKLGDSIYFEEIGAAIATLYIIQLVSSSITWHTVGLALNQRVDELSSSTASLHVTFEFCEISNGSRRVTTNEGVLGTLQIRIPFWVESTSGSLVLNNEALNATLTSGEFLQLTRVWQIGDKIELFSPVLLRTEKVKDDRDMYSSLHAIFFGPYLLAGMSSGDWDINGVDLQSISSWVTPVADTSRENLFSFSQENPAGNDFVFLSHKHASLSMNASPLKGTSEAAYSTFRLVDPVSVNLLAESCLNATLKGMVRIVQERRRQENEIHNELIGKFVSIEPLDLPGSFLMHSNVTRRVEIVRASRPRSMGEDDGQHINGADAVFQVVPGLWMQQNYTSFESASKPGCFLYTENDGYRHVSVGCETSKDDQQFNKAASFLIHKPLTSYHAMSFIAKGVNKEFLLSPLLSFMDESYTVFFNITS